MADGFITRRGGGNAVTAEKLSGTFTGTTSSTVTIPDLIGKNKFVISMRSHPMNSYGTDLTAYPIYNLVYDNGEIWASMGYFSTQDGCTVSGGKNDKITFDKSTGTIDATALGGYTFDFRAEYYYTTM